MPESFIKRLSHPKGRTKTWVFVDGSMCFSSIGAASAGAWGRFLGIAGASSKAVLGQSRAALLSTRVLLIGFASPLDKVSHRHNLFNSSFSALVASALFDPLGASLSNRIVEQGKVLTLVP